MRHLVGLVALVLVAVACSSPTDPTSSTTPEATPTSAPAPTTTASTIEPVPTTEAVAPTTTPPTTTTTLPQLLGLAWQEVVRVDGFVTAIEPVGEDVLFASKDGRVHRWSAGELSVLADYSGIVRSSSNEQGLLDLAIHPDGSRLFLHHTGGNGQTVLAEVPYPPVGAEPVELFDARQPAGNHNGGSIEFGPDGMLYLALGDGGGANDRYGQGQRSDTPLAAIHRFDVSSPGVATPAAGNPGFEEPTIWLFGVRNPWRIAFTPATWSGPDGPLLIVADVGQNRWEEVTFLPADAGGENLGWPIQEGRSCFSRSPCDDPDLRMAQVAVAHGDAGTCSITGGEVYVGSGIPELFGHYLFTDYCGGYLRSVDLTAGVEDPAAVAEWDAPQLGGPAVVAAGPDGEVLAAGGDGRVLRLVAVREG